MKVKLAKEMGFCFGVKRAYDLASKSNISTAIMGELVHNKDVQDSLYDKGIIDFKKDIKVDNLILRSHGTDKKYKEELSKKYNLIDTTCPVLLNIYKQMQKYELDGYLNVIIGDPNHPEVMATKSQVDNAFIVFNLDDIDLLPKDKRLFFTMQTTLNDNKAEEIVLKIKDTLDKDKYIIKNTICSASRNRREAIEDLSKEVDCILIFGGENSNNTKELSNLLLERKFPHYLIKDINSLDLSLIKRYNIVGLSAGASTPSWIIEEAVRVLNDMDNDDGNIEEKINSNPSGVGVFDSLLQDSYRLDEPTDKLNDGYMPTDTVTESNQENEGDTTMNTNELETNVSNGENVNNVSEQELSNTAVETTEPGHATMQEMMEETFTRIRRGQIVPGKILYVTENQIMVNIGFRSDGIVDRDELPEGITDPREHFKKDDEIDVYIVKIDDGEGNVVLSLRRIKDVQVWEDLEKKFENNETFQATIKEEVNKGLVADYEGARLFMPASHAYDRFRRNLSGLVGETVEVELIDFDKSRRKAIISRRRLERERIAKETEEFWANIEEGKVIKGTVARIVDFGAFINLGAYDGLVHVTDYSWNKVRNPKNFLKVGEEIEVKVLSFDREQERISLGIKQLKEDPWKVFTENYKVGDTVTGKVVSLPDFGAFVNIIEGVDGLIHISQICDEHIEKPSDVLNLGQEVSAKITDIRDDQRVSLSIKALTVPEKPERERRPRRERKAEDGPKKEKEDSTPIDNPLIDSDILGELKKMALDLDITEDTGSEEN